MHERRGLEVTIAAAAVQPDARDPAQLWIEALEQPRNRRAIALRRAPQQYADVTRGERFAVCGRTVDHLLCALEGVL